MGNKSLSDDDGSSANLCEGCSTCCRYVSAKIDPPSNPEDLDMAIWYLYHGLSIFVDEDGWYLQINADCSQLNEAGECKVYDTRPIICRNYSQIECEKNNPDAYWHYFKTPEELQAYLKDNPTCKSKKPKIK